LHDLVIELIPVDLPGEPHQFVLPCWLIWSNLARNRSRDPIVPRFFGRFVSLPCRHGVMPRVS